MAEVATWKIKLVRDNIEIYVEGLSWDVINKKFEEIKANQKI
jgi:hypothetical protein